MNKRSIVFGAVMAGTFFTSAMAKNTFGNLGTGIDVRNNLSSETSSSNSNHSMEFTCSSDTTKMKEAKCGEAKCGDKKVTTESATKAVEGKCGEGKCGDKKATMTKTTEAKCGDKKVMTNTKSEKKAARKANKAK
jgi:uncharacterized low-complexity protein